MADEKKDALAALRAQVETEEADAANALSKDEAEFAELSQRLDAARAAKRSKLGQLRHAKLMDRLTAAKEAASGAYVLDILDAEDQTDGAGSYLVRSPDRQTWKEFKEAVNRSNNDTDKVDRAYRNIANKCIVWPKVGVDVTGEDMSDRYDRYSSLAQVIGDFAGKLGALAAGDRKR